MQFLFETSKLCCHAKCQQVRNNINPYKQRDDKVGISITSHMHPYKNNIMHTFPWFFAHSYCHCKTQLHGTSQSHLQYLAPSSSSSSSSSSLVPRVRPVTEQGRWTGAPSQAVSLCPRHGLTATLGGFWSLWLAPRWLAFSVTITPYWSPP